MAEFIGTIKDVKNETHDVKSFLVDVPKLDFTPGQYALVSIVEKPGLPQSGKPLTFANAPGETVVKLTVKEIGEFTKAIGTLKPGDKVKIDGPRGNSLNFDENVKEDVVFLAGGSGITPFRAAIDYAVKKNLKNNIVLLFGNRTEEDIIYKDEFEKIDADNENIRIVNFVGEGDESRYEIGFIDKERVLKYVPDPKEKLFYVCGPPAMTQACCDTLAEIGVPDDHVKRDKWEIPGKGSN